MADYCVDINGKVTKKKKEQKKCKYYVDINGKVTKAEDSEDRTWFKKGAFRDGYQFGDVLTSVGSTIGDASLGILQGAGNMVEGVVDLGMYGVAGISDLVGADSFADKVKNTAKKNAVDGWADRARDFAFQDSLLGEKSVDVASGLGQVGTMLLTAGAGQAAGLGIVGASALSSGTMFASSTGTGMSEAYQGGASDGEAVAYGALKGAVDAGTELMFGGLGKTVKALGVSKGIASLDDIFAKKLTNKISNQTVKTLSQYGIKAAGEGVEEVLAGLGSAVAKKLTYMSDAELKQLVKDENLLDQFVIGAITSGIAQGGDAIRSLRSGTDYVTGLTKNEELVVEKEAQNRIAEREAKEKLSNKEKNEIYEQVKSDLFKGRIDIDTIESALGGETYKNYMSATEQENALQKEYDTLNKMKQGEMTGEQSDRREELKQKLQELKTGGESSKLKEKLYREVSLLAETDRLSESYREKERRSQSFEVDLTKYSAKQQPVVKKAMESGILNNTNWAHEFVDMVAKISADKGVSFDFTNNQKLKESGFALEGKTVNGFLKDGNISLNIESKKALNAVVGHEITHVLEGTELYGELQQVVKAYAESKGEYGKRLETLQKLYEGVEGANIENELTADLIGDYLFTDSDFVNRLSTEKPGLFKRIFEEIKYLLKKATAGSKQARELEKVKRTFEKAYKENGSATTDEVKYSMQRDNKGKEYWKIDTHKDIFKGLQTTKEIEEAAFEYILQQRDGNVVVDAIDGKKMSFIRISAEEFTNSEESQGLKKNDPVAFAQKMRLIPSLEDLAGNASVNWWSPDLKKHNLFKERGFENFRGRVGIDNVIFNYVIRSGKARFGDVFYDINLEVDQILPHTNGASEIKRSTSDNSIPQIEKNATTSSKINVLTDEGLTMTYVRVPNQNTRNYGSTYGQNIEPAGEYMSMDTMQGQHKIEGYEYGTIQFKKPLVLEHISTSDTGWKKTVSDMYNGLTGKKLTQALIKDGYDAIVTYDEYGYSEIVNLNGTKLNGIPQKEINASGNTRYSLGERNLEERVSGDALLDAQDLISEIEDVAEISPSGYVTLYHRTTEENARKIMETRRMSAKEDGIFFSTKEDGENSVGYGKGVVKLRVPAEKLVLDDIFSDEAHVRIPLKTRNEVLDISEYLDDTSSVQHSLGDDIAPPIGTYNVYGKDIALDLPIRNDLPQEGEIAPVQQQKITKENLGPVRKDIAPVEQKEPLKDIGPVRSDIAKPDDQNTEENAPAKQYSPDELPTWEGVKEKPITRSELHQDIMENIEAAFSEKGYNLEDVLSNAKNIATFRTVDNTPQRVMEKALGYKEGQILSDLTVNKVAQNETEGIKWLNSFTDRKKGFLKQISKQYNIKSGSKESAAAQMYAEGFYVNSKNEIVAYGDAELAADFPDAKVRENIKGLATDPRIRQVYDETLRLINESRTRNAYPEIPRLENYFLHFRAMDDTFSRLGLPFNPNDIRAKDLPTDLNGVTADLKPGKPYFASEQHRKGKRTSFDLLGGLERYLTSAKNQIFHIDDIQTLRALRNYVVNRYGQANGLENLDILTEEEAQERISQVYGSHLSTFAKFLNEEANIIAGKTALIDRGLEGIIGRRGITALNEINRQVGANMVGFNASSAGTNFLAAVQALAKLKKKSVAVKALAQMTTDKVSRLTGGEGDGFATKSPVMIRRKGAERFYRTPYQKIGDWGYALMSAVDNVTTEFIARAKYNELTADGMDAEMAHYETDKWVSRLMGDRSLGQMPQLYNSRMLGLLTKFQLEVRNQLDSQFYDTIQEVKMSTEEIEDRLRRNMKRAARIGSTFFQLAVLQHLFGKVYESVAGYNPAFDIVEAIIKLFGWDDEEDSEDTVLDNIEEGFLTLLEDMPYSSLVTDGGRIPISSALPIKQLVSGKDDYGNEKSRLKTLGETLPYYVLPGGYGQIKKSYQGLKMFDDDLPIAGSYTNSGNLRFAVEDTFANRVQASIFGQYANENARDYFDNERTALKEKQIQELVDSGLPMADYWKYRDGLKGKSGTQEKIEYIAGLDLPITAKNVLVNNAVDRETPVDLTEYDRFAGYEEFDFFSKNKELYKFLQDNGVSYADYKVIGEEGQERYKKLKKDPGKQTFLKEIGVSVSEYCNSGTAERATYDWAYKNPEEYRLSQIVTPDVMEYKRIVDEINDITSDRDKRGKTISDSKKKKIFNYIKTLEIDYGQKMILFRSIYNDDDTYNYEIVEYMNERNDISRTEAESILKSLGLTVHPDGRVTW